MTLNINEVFGPTIQGEGRFTGRRAFFVRTSRCPLACSFCDTPYTWAFTENKAKKHREGVKYNQILEEHQMSSEEVVEKLDGLGLKLGDLVVLTGGEPLLQASEIKELVNALLLKGCLVQFETAGVLKPPHFDDDLRVFYSVSPKLENSGNPLRVRFRPEVLKELNSRSADFKFVCASLEDLDEVHEFCHTIGISPSHVWIMPEGVTHEVCQEHAKLIIDKALELGYNFSMRVHVAIWGTERGR